MSESTKNTDTSEATLAAKRESAKRTRRDFLVLGLGALGAYEFYNYLESAPQVGELSAPFRAAVNWNHAVSEAVFHDRVLAPTYPKTKAKMLRVNGNFGLKQDLVPEGYRLQVVGVKDAAQHPRYVSDVTAWEYRYATPEAAYSGHDTKERPKEEAAAGTTPAPAPKERGVEEAGESDSTLPPSTPGLLLTMDDLKALPKRELVTQFKCIEGWSEIVYWGGYRLADFIAAYPPAPKADGTLPRYVYMETPNGDYYTGYELHECTHPQSFLATEMGGEPLAQAHGWPLRLHMPIKYGYKQIKRIGLIAYTDEKPDDYWTKLGYDWYAGL